MNQQHTIRLSSWARLVGLALLLGVGLLASLGLASGTVHAATTLTVTNCSNDSQLQADVSTANSDNANDTITFACSGAIPLTSTLNITGSMTLHPYSSATAVSDTRPDKTSAPIAQSLRGGGRCLAIRLSLRPVRAPVVECPPPSRQSDLLGVPAGVGGRR